MNFCTLGMVVSTDSMELIEVTERILTLLWKLCVTKCICFASVTLLQKSKHNILIIAKKI
jgi:hypothetical protein